MDEKLTNGERDNLCSSIVWDIGQGKSGEHTEQCWEAMPLICPELVWKQVNSPGDTGVRMYVHMTRCKIRQSGMLLQQMFPN